MLSVRIDTAESAVGILNSALKPWSDTANFLEFIRMKFFVGLEIGITGIVQFEVPIRPKHSGLIRVHRSMRLRAGTNRTQLLLVTDEDIGGVVDVNRDLALVVAAVDTV